MSFEQTRFTIMALPQHVDTNGVMTLHIVFIPRNINPLKEVNTVYHPSGKAAAFVDVKPAFEVMLVNNPDEFPGKIPANETTRTPLSPLTYSAIQGDIYKTLRDAKDDQNQPKYFDIDDSRSADINPNSTHTAPKASTNRNQAIRKYLPKSYRSAFHFSSPRLPNAVTDDSYHCAMRDQTPPKPFTADKQVSWGKVYAHLLRQPLMARQAGLIYEMQIQLTAGDYENGGWLYAQIAAGTTYDAEQQNSMSHAEGPFIKRYAARIPSLKPGEARSLFSAVLFPVVKKNESPAGVYDDLYIEAARFNTGFAGIVHANQPVSGNLLQEEEDGFHPQKEIGIRLGWEDEQILEWYLRQMAVDQSTNERLDAPLGVMGYQVDVRNHNDPAATWESLNHVSSNGDMMLESINMGSFQGELPYQVYPTKIYDGNNTSEQYWLPMYFANWNNHSIVLPDKTAATIYQHHAEKNTPVTISETYKEAALQTTLRYGHEYDFRVRLTDISGGGPAMNTPSPANAPISHIAKAAFKRYVAPNAITIVNSADIKSNTDDQNFNAGLLTVSRPLLGYPAALYTGKYSNPVERLAQSVRDLIDLQVATKNDPVSQGARAFGIPDPDVTEIEIKVEVETLNMDNLASDDGREHYLTLFRVSRQFATFDEMQADVSIDVPIRFIDAPVLDFDTAGSPYANPADNTFLNETNGELVLPTARNLRITLRAIGETNPAYWGIEHPEDATRNSRYGKTTVLTMRQESANEQTLFAQTNDPQTLQGIYLQPDPVVIKPDPILFRTLQGGTQTIPDIVHRLGDQLNVAVKGLTLSAYNGERLQFWCSNHIRHSLSPDNSSITFTTKNELQDHWLVCTTLIIHRDWTWDSLDASSFFIYRKHRMGNDINSIAQKAYEFIGDLELKKTASYQAIQKGKDKKIHREYTRIILIDVVDVKPAVGKLPEIIDLQYRVEPKFRNGHQPIVDTPYESGVLTLPTTENPSQTPKLIGAGIALSPYNRNKTYSATEARTRFLWLEFDQKPVDKNDGLFCRVLAYSPDQLISNNHPTQLELPQEMPLTLDPEYIRVITPESGHDHNGLDAMQEMQKSLDTNRHFYILPLPPGLHHESAELFGMFTYEFRIGHTDRIWSTAQARFGRPLRVTGLQHPAPTLPCMVNRNEKSIQVNAPYAIAVYNGNNVTASPPRTSLWALLYAQVKQADGLDYRNILLAELPLKPKPRRRQRDILMNLRKEQELMQARARESGQTFVALTNEVLIQQSSQIAALERESALQGYGVWLNSEVNDMLRLYGLPADSSLSILCVEVYGQITNAFEHIDNFESNKQDLVHQTSTVFNPLIADQVGRSIAEVKQAPEKAGIDPLNSQLGLHRILRTSPLTEVPFVCCTDCDE